MSTANDLKHVQYNNKKDHRKVNRIYFWYYLASIIELTNLIVEIYRNILGSNGINLKKIVFIKDDRKAKQERNTASVGNLRALCGSVPLINKPYVKLI
jgi:hypothetical protein